MGTRTLPTLNPPVVTPKVEPPLANRVIITHEGTTGVFTPLESEAAEEQEKLRQSLEQSVERLRGELVDVRAANLTLQEKLNQLSRPVRTPDDLASAIGRSLDQLQTRLSAVTNPLVSFAVKEFRIETNVHVSVSALGNLEYRFVQPGDDINPQFLSRITLDLVPVAKDSAAGSLDPKLFQADKPLDTIRDIGKEAQAILEGNQIHTVGDLRAVASRATASAELVGLLRVERDRLARWLTLSELLTVRGIDGTAAEILAACGIASLRDLADLAAEPLVEQFNAKMQELKSAERPPLTPGEAGAWIRAARAFCGVNG